MKDATADMTWRVVALTVTERHKNIFVGSQAWNLKAWWWITRRCRCWMIMMTNGCAKANLTGVSGGPKARHVVSSQQDAVQKATLKLFRIAASGDASTGQHPMRNHVVWTVGNGSHDHSLVDGVRWWHFFLDTQTSMFRTRRCFTHFTRRAPLVVPNQYQEHQSWKITINWRQFCGSNCPHCGLSDAHLVSESRQYERWCLLPWIDMYFDNWCQQ